MASPYSSPIKIGFTEGSIAARLQGLQTGAPYELRLLFAVPGNYAEEGAIHKAFAADRLKGEWFKRSRRLMHFLAAIGRGEPISEALIYRKQNPEKLTY
jgi:hypothetical protein